MGRRLHWVMLDNGDLPSALRDPSATIFTWDVINATSDILARLISCSVMGKPMPKPRVLVLRAPGTNCDVESAYAFEKAGAVAVSLHVNRLIDNPRLADNYQILCLPGGFSYGDDIAAGRILAAQLQSRLADMLDRFRQDDRLILGICNGFQVMMRLGIFFEESSDQAPATLFWNAQGRFESRWVHLKVAGSNSPFFRGIDTMYLPMAHAEGRILFRSPEAAHQLQQEGQLALQYCMPDGNVSETPLAYPWNPNGAARNIAGLSDATGRIVGLMPHPERHLEATHHPAWTRRASQPEHGDGFAMFQNAVEYFASN